MDAESVSAGKAVGQLLVFRGARDVADEITGRVELEGGEGGIAAEVSAGMNGGLIDRLCIDALQLVWGHGVEDDPETEVLNEVVGRDQMAPLPEGDREEALLCLQQEDRGSGGIAQNLAEIAGRVRV